MASLAQIITGTQGGQTATEGYEVTPFSGVNIGGGGGGGEVAGNGLLTISFNGATTTFSYNGGFQSYVVSTTRGYDVTAYGAQGGGSAADYSLNGPGTAGGLGAVIDGAVSLTAGDILRIAVGGQGGFGQANPGSIFGGYAGGGGGGGGTFLFDLTTDTLLAVAGGGGGADGITDAAGGPFIGGGGTYDGPGGGSSGGGGDGTDYISGSGAAAVAAFPRLPAAPAATPAWTIILAAPAAALVA